MYKVGDKVRVRPDLHINNLYDGEEAPYDWENFRGKVVTISYVDESIGYYLVEEDTIGSAWTESMFCDEPVIKDDGHRVPMGNTGFVRDSHEGKGRMDLLPWTAIMELSKHCERGAIKYGERNVDKGAPMHSLLDSALRHIAKYMEGYTDEDHLLSAFWNIAWAVQQELKMPSMQDIPNRLF